ncbi:hypothetical protein F2Q69_00053385 [Brassica cretica]|uniref:Uncharacterized protein n=1 Tax=Brassica cretica TaxID=69181 RepID=A0A8S9N526_BRACR|nr:hypothetical protein F2Q69_00053385 [Brassica cretica]
MNERRTKRRFDTDSTSTAPPPPPVRDQHPWPRKRELDPIPLFAHFDNPRTAAKSLECKNLEIRDEWDDYDNIFYNEWLKVSIEPTRFVDPDQEQPGPALPPFLPMPDMSTRPEGDFQCIVIDALTAMLARVSRCRCSSRRSVRSSSPSAAGRSHQRSDDSEETTDESTDED